MSAPTSEVVYVDESIDVDSGLYVLAGVWVHNHAVEEARAELKAALLFGQPRFHRRKEGVPQREALLKRVASLELVSSVYVHRMANPRKQVRPRRLCLNGLLWDMRELALDKLVIESRDEHGNSDDRKTARWAQNRQQAPRPLTYSFERPHSEPLLWPSDAIAGVTKARLCAGDRTWDTLLADCALSVREV